MEFIIFNGYRGVFKVIENKATGEFMVDPDGTATVHVPENGIVMLNSVATLKSWHKVIAIYKSGQRLPLGDIGELPAPQSIALFSLWTTADGSTYYLVGTKAEYDKLQKENPFKADDFLPKR